jgi:8-hydroxy-5-deazaflavin:NADPH oxidoreductase
MRIAIIGTGSVGLTLGRRLAEVGHHVIFGSRRKNDPDVCDPVARIGHRVEIATVSEAIEESDLVVLAVPYQAALDLAQREAALAGKVVVDVTNPLTLDFSGLTIGHQSSAAEELQRLAPASRVVKAFNTTGAENMALPRYGQTALFMPVAGDDAKPKAQVIRLAREIGFDAIDVGPLAQARLLEPLALLWITLAHAGGLGRDIGFALLRRGEQS